MYRQQHNFSKWRAVSGFAEGSNMKHNSPDPACAMELHRQCSTYSYFIIHKIIANPLRKFLIFLKYIWIKNVIFIPISF